MKTLLALALAAMAIAPAYANGDSQRERDNARRSSSYNAPYDPPPPVETQTQTQTVYVQQPLPPPDPSRWYVEVYGGANWANNWDQNFGPVHVDTNDDTGGVGGVVVGRKIASMPGFSLEADASFRDGDANTRVTTPGPTFTIPGNDRDWSLLANLRYEVLIGHRVRPYLLVGGGYGSHEFNIKPFGVDFKLEDQGFAWQAGAGVLVDITDEIALGVGYRYHDAPDIDRVFGPIHFNKDGVSQSVVAEVRVAL